MADTLIIQVPDRLLYSPRLKRWVLVSEVTSKTSNDLFLFVPLEVVVAILNGIIGRAQARCHEEGGFGFDFDLYGYFFMSNHLHWLIGVDTLVHKSIVLEWVNREIARRINKFHDRSGQALVPSTAIQITTLEKALDRLRYVMGQGTAAMKSRHPNDDVFACSNPALLRGEKLHGVFVHADGRREETTVRIDRLPGLGDLTEKEHRALMWQLADGIAAEARPRRKKAGLPVPDPEAVRKVDPMTRPKERDRSPAPVVHGPPEHQEEWRKLHAELKDAYTTAHIAYWKWLADPTLPLIPFPANTIPPSHARKKLRALAESG
ncbi:MAG: hypothetical protein R3F39_26175 [Myxococcota bacterium]